MRGIIGILPTYRFENTDSPYDDAYKFVPLYSIKVHKAGGIPIGILLNDKELDIIKEINEVETSKIKFLFIGAFIGALPYILLFVALGNHLQDRILFRNTLIIFAFLSIVINAIMVSRTVYNRYKDFLEFKYDTKYNELKKYFE
jgi:multisubunit Na+/H+ antiporter MnhF subunit